MRRPHQKKQVLMAGKTPLGFVRWRDRYQGMMKENARYGDGSGYLFFRNLEAPHALRETPSEQSKRIAWIGSDHAIFPLEIRENWMHVQVYQPSNFCQTDWQGKVKAQEGWIRWLDQQQGNCLSEPYKGC